MLSEIRLETDGGTPIRKLENHNKDKVWEKQFGETLLASGLPLDAMHKYDPISLRDNLDSFNTSPPKDVTVD